MSSCNKVNYLPVAKTVRINVNFNNTLHTYGKENSGLYINYKSNIKHLLWKLRSAVRTKGWFQGMFRLQ